MFARMPRWSASRPVSSLLHRTAEKRERLGPAAQRLLGVSELNGSKTCLSLVSVCVFGPGALRAGLRARRRRTGRARSHRDRRARCRRRWLAAHEVRAHVAALLRRPAGSARAQPDRARPADPGRWRRWTTATTGSRAVWSSTPRPRSARASSSGRRSSALLLASPTPTSVRTPRSAAGAEIEGAEIERSIIADGARIMHVGGRIEASTVGRSASIFRDFALPRAMRLHVGDGVELALN